METARYVRIASWAVGSLIESASSDSTTPGEMVVTRMLGSLSSRSPSVIAQAAYLLAQYTAPVGTTSWAPMDAIGDEVSAPLAFEMRQCRGDPVEQTPNIHVDHLIPLVDQERIQPRQGHHARVVDEHVDSAELADRTVDQSGDVVARGHVDRARNGRSAVRVDLPGDVVEPISPPRREHDLVPFGTQPGRGRLPNAAARSA